MLVLVLLEFGVAAVSHQLVFAKEVSCHVQDSVIDLLADRRPHSTRVVGREKLIEDKEETLIVVIYLVYACCKTFSPFEDVNPGCHDVVPVFANQWTLSRLAPSFRRVATPAGASAKTYGWGR